MLAEQFRAEMGRIIGTFGKAAYSEERTDLIHRAIKGLGYGEFSRVVDHMISTFRYPPLPKDFAEAAIAERKKRFDQDVHGAAQAMRRPWQGGLKAYLEKDFPGCKTLAEAVEVRRLQIQLARAENPNYDPMTDPKWT